MARIRTLKPEILEDEKTASLSDGAFRLFTSVIVLADDFGNCRASTGWLIGQVWWARGNPPRVAEFLRELSDAGLVQTYAVRGQLYVHVTNWTKHQRIDNAGKARVPGPEDADSSGPVNNPPNGGNSPRDSASLGEIPLDPDPEGERERDPEGEGERRTRGEMPRRKRAKSPAVILPVDWAPTYEHECLARERGVDLTLQARTFRAHAEANDRRAVRWNAAFTQWLLKAFPDRHTQAADGLAAVLRIANGVDP